MALPTPVAEANCVVDWIQKKIERKTQPSEIALLARSSRSLENMELSLKLHKIPYRKYGGLSLGDAAEVKDFIAFIRVAFNENDRVAMVRCLTQFPGVGEAAAHHYVEADDQPDDSLFKMERTLPRGAGSLKQWLAKLRTIRDLGGKGEYLKSVFYPLLQRNYPSDHGERMQTIDSLVSTMKETNATTADFLDAFSLEKSTPSYHHDHEITVATIHASKGLEFEAVILCGAGSGQMPHPKSLDVEAYEEERRLMYVAVTRAKNHLLITYPIDGVPKFPNQKLSPFLNPLFKWDSSY
jgi:DNA helicase-2/ATP-dependent DNA helicase PcrA